MRIAITDNICTEGVLTTASSVMLENFIPPYSATVIEKLGGEVLLENKLSAGEFGIGNPSLIADVAERIKTGGCDAAICADMDGSILNTQEGFVSLRPTWGRVSRFGLVAFASSTDQICPVAKTVQECAEILSKIAGHDPNDATTVKSVENDFTSKIGNVSVTVKSETAESLFEKIDYAEYCKAVHLILTSAESASNLSRYDGIKFGHRTERDDDWSSLIANSRAEGFGDEIKKRIILGNHVLGHKNYEIYYKKALAVRKLIKTSAEALFAEGCVIILDKFTEELGCLISLASLTAISTGGKIIVGKPFDEAAVIAVADSMK